MLVSNQGMLRIFLYLGLSASLALSLQARAAAQDAPSQQQIAAGNELLQAGKQAYSAGHFAEALYDFEQAYQRLERPSILYRIGDAADKLGDHERAVTALRQYLETQLNSPDRTFIESRIQANLDAIYSPAPGPAAISPEAAANSSRVATASEQLSEAAPRRHASAAGPWWLWAGAGTLTLVGVVVAAIIVGAASAHEQPPVKGNVGGVVQTLGAP